MSNLVAGSVTYSLVNARKLGDSRNLNRVSLSFGDGALTYPAGGIPITIAKLGCPTVVESLIVVDKGTSGYEFKYDQSAKKLVMFHQGSHVHDILALGGLTSSEPLLLDASVKYGKNAATNRTIAGANSATNGGIQAVIPGAMAEPSAVAIAAQTIEVEVIGW